MPLTEPDQEHFRLILASVKGTYSTLDNFGITQGLKESATKTHQQYFLKAEGILTCAAAHMVLNCAYVLLVALLAFSAELWGLEKAGEEVILSWSCSL